MNNPSQATPYFLIAGHHKAGTALFTQVGLNLAKLYQLPFLDISHQSSLSPEREMFFFLPQAWHETAESHALATYTSTPPSPKMKGIHFIRDPRDMIVSGYYSHLISHSTESFQRYMRYYYDTWNLQDFRSQLEQMDKRTGLLAELEFMEWTFQQMDEWDYHDDRYYTLRFESYLRDPQATICEITKHLDLPDLSAEHIDHIAFLTQFKNATAGREPGEEDITHHLRKGVPGDWVNHFYPELERRFMARWGHLLEKLGYV